MYSIQEQVDQIYQGMTIDVPAGQKLYGVFPGDKVRVKATIQFRGPVYSDTFYAAIGEWRGITWPTDIGFFDEIWKGSIPVSFNAATDWVSYELTVDISITQVGLFPWTPGWFDIYAKLVKPGIGGLLTPRLDNMIEVLLKPEFQYFTIASYDRIPGA